MTRLATLVVSLLCALALADQPVPVTGKITGTNFASGTFTAKTKAEFFGNNYTVSGFLAPPGAAQRMLNLQQRMRQANTVDDLKALYTKDNAEAFEKQHKGFEEAIDINRRLREPGAAAGNSRIYVVVNASNDRGQALYVAWDQHHQAWEELKPPVRVFVVRQEDGQDRCDHAAAEDPLAKALAQGEWKQFGAPHDLKAAPATRKAE